MTRPTLAVTGLVVVLALIAVVFLSGRGASSPGSGEGHLGTSSPYDASGRAVRELPRVERAPNLIVILVDSLRGDAAANGMPFLASLAARGVRFPEAVSHAPWGMPSAASVLTGLLPSAHGAMDERQPPSLPDAYTTFAEILARSYGYDTAAFVDGPWWGGSRALLQGFDHAASGFALQGTEEILGPWARARKPGRPFFLLLHTREAAEPYGPANHPWPATHKLTDASTLARAESVFDAAELTRMFLLDRPLREVVLTRRGAAARREVAAYTSSGFARDPRPELPRALREAYGSGVTWVDGLLRRTVERFEAWGLLENTVIVVTSPNGVSFGEHGMLGTGRQLYDEQLRVPLVLVHADALRAGTVVNGTVGLTDVLPTFFDLAGFPLPVPLDGRTLLSALSGTSVSRPILSEEILSNENTGGPVEGIRASVRSPTWRYVVTHDRTAGTIVEELFDLAADPGERHDLVAAGGSPFGRVDAETCRTIDLVRKRIWAGADSDAGRVGTPYGASLSTVTSTAPSGCGPTDGSAGPEGR